MSFYTDNNNWLAPIALNSVWIRVKKLRQKCEDGLLQYFLFFLQKKNWSDAAPARRTTKALWRIPGRIPRRDEPRHSDHHQELRSAHQPLWSSSSWNIQSFRFTGDDKIKIKTLCLDIVICNFTICTYIQMNKLKPWSSGHGWRLMYVKSWVRIPAPYTWWRFGHFSHRL